MKPGRVGVDDIDHLAGELGLDRHAENVDQPRRAIAEQRAFDPPWPLFGADGHGDQGMVVAFALVADFPYGNPALLGEVRGVDHVHRVRPGAHDTCQHGARDRFDVQLGGGAFDLDVDRADLGAGDLPDQPPELFRESHVRFEPRRFLGRERRHVYGVRDSAKQQIVAHLLGDLDRDIDLRLCRRGAEVRRADEPARSEQRIVFRRLLGKHIERGTGDVAAVESLFQRRFIDQPAASAIDDANAWLRLGERLAAEDAAGLVGQRRM